MSANNENVDSATRVTRSRRRLNSAESLNQDLESRPDTPTTGRTRQNVKKLELIDENTATPTRRATRAGSIQKDSATVTTPSKRTGRAVSVQLAQSGSTETVLTPVKRLTRAGSMQRLDEIKASPIRRTTRRMSSEASAPPKETSIIVIDDEDSISENALTPRNNKIARRISAMTKLEEVQEVLEEEPVSIESAQSNSDINKSTDTVDELELRNRSISKSPSLAQRTSLNTAENNSQEEAKAEEVQNIADIVPDESQTTSPTKGLNKFLTSRVSFSDDDYAKSPTKNPISQLKLVLLPPQTLLETDAPNDEISIDPSPSKGTPTKNGTPQRKSTSQRSQLSSEADAPNDEIVVPASPSKGTPQRKSTSQRSQLSSEADAPNDEIVVAASPSKGTPQRKSTSQRSQLSSEADAPNDEIVVSASPSKGTPQRKSTLSQLSQLSSEADVPYGMFFASFPSKGSPTKSETQYSQPIIEVGYESRDGELFMPLSSPDETPTKYKKMIEFAEAQSSKEMKEAQCEMLKRLISLEKLIEDEKNKTVDGEEEDSVAPEQHVSGMMDDFVTEKSPKSLSRKSLNKSQAYDDDDILSLFNIRREQEYDILKPQPSSWNQSVRMSSTQHIDNLKMAEKEVIKDTSKRLKIVSSDEDEENSEKNSFVDDEAEVGSDDDSLTPSERQCLEENTIYEQGEILGSEDSEFDDDEEEEDDDDDDSFIDKNEDICDEYSLNSEEEQPVKKRKSRIILPSSSEDEDGDVAQKGIPITKSLNTSKIEAAEELEDVEMKDADESPQKQIPAEKPVSAKRKSLNESVASSGGRKKSERKSISSKDQLPGETVSQCKKRKRDNDDEKMVVKPKRAKMMRPNESEAMHMEDNSHLVEETAVCQEEKSNQAGKKREIDIGDIFQRVNQHMTEFKENKKAQAALKKERKAKKLAKKNELQQDVQEQHIDSLDGDNKENAVEKKKKKKKNKAKKQKHIDDVESPIKRDIASHIDKVQEKLELKRQRKREKKLAKMQEKAMKPVAPAAAETAVEGKPTSKKSKKQEKTVQNDEAIAETKSKKNKSKVEEKRIPAAALEVKNKKRKIEEVDDEYIDDIVEKPRAKKKLKVLKQIDEPLQRMKQQKRQHINEPNHIDAAVNLNKKLKKIVHENCDGAAAAAKVKSQKVVKKVIPEPKMSLPRPVFTTAGVFMEEPITPYKFKPKKEYKPIKSIMGRDRVALFQAKKKPAAAPSNDFKSDILKKKTINRDKSVRNLKNLM